MELKAMDIFVTLILNLIHYARSENILSCNETSFEPCPGHYQVCNVTSHECVCLEGFRLVGGDCEASSDDSYSPHNATTAVVVIFMLALIVCGLVLVVRKYNLLDYVRQKINARRNNDVMYEDVMIGNDDPPLSP